MATTPALAARTTLVVDEPSRAVLRRTLQAIVAAVDGLRPLDPRNREVELPLNGSNTLRSERARR